MYSDRTVCCLTACHRPVRLRWRVGQDWFRFNINSYILRGVPKVGEAVFEEAKPAAEAPGQA